MTENNNLTVGEAVKTYSAELAAGEKEACHQELHKFSLWFGTDKPLSGLTAEKVGEYADRYPLSDKDYAKKLDIVKAFLTEAKTQGWTKTNLSVHLKPKKSKPKKTASGAHSQLEVVPVTEEGYAKLKSELGELKLRRPQIIDEITKAAADKDFRENSPLEAAREQHGFIEGRIREIESILKAAEIVYEQKELSHKVNMGDTVILIEVETDTEMCYKIVGPRETDPSKGKISGVSPVGKAVIGCVEGQTVEVIVPVGKIKYQIKQIKR